jgi:hypothetical protein
MKTKKAKKTQEIDAFFLSRYFIKVRDTLESNGVTIDGLRLFSMISEFSKTHGIEAAYDLLGFIAYAEQEKLDRRQITITLLHDLSGCDDSLMLPRSSGYKKHLNS